MKTTKPLLLLSTIILAVSSCKKEVEPDNPPPPSDFSHMEGNFLCNVEDSYAYDPGDESNYDKVISLQVSNDTLYVLGEFFVINSETQTTFTKSTDLILTIVTISLTFQNNYQDVEINLTHNSGPSGGPTSTWNYDGSRTTLPGSGSLHIDEQIMNGLYALTITKLDTYQNIDTTYLDTINVLRAGNYFEFGSAQYSAPEFRHTFMNKNSWSYVTGIGENEETNVYWDRIDSLYFFQETIVNDWSNPEDTVLFECHGRHL